jgi:hypothetical protein
MAIYETLYPQGNFLDIRANAPTSTDYNIQVMEDLVRNLPGGGIRDLLAPATAATLSLPYDAIQAATRTTEDDISRAMETAGMYGPKDIASEAYGLAFGRERPLSSAIERTIGASGPLAERINNLNLFNSAVAAEKPTVPNLSLGYNMPTFDLGTGITNTTAATNMYSPFMDNQETVNQDLVQQIIAENQAKRNLFARPNMLDIAGGITNIDLIEKNELPYSGVGNMRYTTPRTIADQNKILGQTFTEEKPSGAQNLLKLLRPGNLIGSLLAGILPKDPPEVRRVKDFYARNFGVNTAGSVASGIMQGYNPVSGGFLNYMTGGKYGEPMQVGLGRAMQRSIENILGRKAPQTDASRAKVKELRNLQLQEMRDRAAGGESLGSIGKSTFSGKGGAFEKRSGGSSGKKGTSSERNYGGR